MIRLSQTQLNIADWEFLLNFWVAFNSLNFTNVRTPLELEDYVLVCGNNDTETAK